MADRRLWGGIFGQLARIPPGAGRARSTCARLPWRRHSFSRRQFKGGRCVFTTGLGVLLTIRIGPRFLNPFHPPPISQPLAITARREGISISSRVFSFDDVPVFGWFSGHIFALRYPAKGQPIYGVVCSCGGGVVCDDQRSPSLNAAKR